MTAEIIPFARWRRCDCEYSRTVAEAWNETGGPSRISLDAFLVEHARLLRPYDCLPMALLTLAERGSRRSRSLAKSILDRTRLPGDLENCPGDGEPSDAA
jgi:hypothetical protein